MATLVLSERAKTLLERGEGYLAIDHDKRTLPQGVTINRAAGYLIIKAERTDNLGRDVTDHVWASPDGSAEIHEELCDCDSWTREEKIADQEALVGQLLDQIPPAA